MTERSLDWRAYLNKLQYCTGCGRFGLPQKGKRKKKPPRGWKVVYQPHPDAPAGLLVCSQKCEEKVRAAMAEGPIYEPLEIAKDIPMTAEMRSQMLDEAMDFALKQGRFNDVFERRIVMSDDKPKVVEMPSSDKPVAEIDPRQRLGTLIQRYRINAGKSLEGLGACLDVPPTILSEVEKGLATLQAGQLQQAARFLGVRYEPLLDAARDWHNALWEEKGEQGVTLAEMTTKTTSLKSRSAADEAAELELALIRAADDLVFLSNVARETSIRAEQAALQARDLLEKRGVLVPSPEPLDGPETVECAGPVHSLPVTLQRGKDFVLAFEPEDGGETVYFCSKRCGDEWRAKKATETP